MFLTHTYTHTVQTHTPQTVPESKPAGMAKSYKCVAWIEWKLVEILKVLATSYTLS